MAAMIDDEKILKAFRAVLDETALTAMMMKPFSTMVKVDIEVTTLVERSVASQTRKK